MWIFGKIILSNILQERKEVFFSGKRTIPEIPDLNKVLEDLFKSILPVVISSVMKAREAGRERFTERNPQDGSTEQKAKKI